uniref:NADH-ubiquinone oxidoreductase chain 2 n=2 Tax=unclassified Nephtys TaxID=2628724 RepID=B2C6R0_9ANNE
MTSSFPYISLFFSTMTLGTLMTLSANQWLYVWMGLELNLLSFVPLITSSSMNRESEAAMKYFLAQAMGSGLLLLGVFTNMMFSAPSLTINPGASFIFFALLLKLGAAPCHFWFPAVMSNISWPLCMTLATWQKIAPLNILMFSNSLNQSSLVLSVAALGSLIGGIGGLNQTQLRPLFAYSSIGHLGWMISTPSFLTLIIYLTIYIFITSAMMIIFWKLSTKHWSFNISLLKSSPATTFSIIILLFSLAGLPPFIGFLPKWLILSSLTSSGASLLWPLVLVLGSAIQLFYYLSLMFAFFMKSPNYSSLTFSPSSSKNQIITCIATATLGLAP